VRKDTGGKIPFSIRKFKYLIRPDKEYFSTASEYSAFRTGEKEGIPFIPYNLLIDIYVHVHEYSIPTWP
jgi:hypothetical protein